MTHLLQPIRHHDPIALTNWKLWPTCSNQSATVSHHGNYNADNYDRYETETENKYQSQIHIDGISKQDKIQVVKTDFLWIQSFRSEPNVTTTLENQPHYYYHGAWWLTGRFDAIRPKGHRFKFRSSRHVGTLGKSFTHSLLWRFSVKHRHNIRAVLGAPLSSNGLEEVQYK